MKMEIKLDESGKYAVVQDGKPVFVLTEDDGKVREEAFDLSRMMLKIKELNKENKDHREKAEGLNASLTEIQTKYKDLPDPAIALEAIQKVGTMTEEQKKIAADHAKIEEKYKREAQLMIEQERKNLQTEHETKMKTMSEALQNAESTTQFIVKKNAFSGSKFFNGGESALTILPPDIAQNSFGHFFTVEGSGENVRLIGRLNGDIIPSQNPDRIGEPADFDEAIGAILAKHPSQASLMRATAGGPNQRSMQHDSSGKNIILSKAQYSDPGAYRAAKQKAAETGGTVIMAET